MGSACFKPLPSSVHRGRHGDEPEPRQASPRVVVPAVRVFHLAASGSVAAGSVPGSGVGGVTGVRGAGGDNNIVMLRVSTAPPPLPSPTSSLTECVPGTPKSQSSPFKLYCPLCMCYFRGLHVTQCCKHHICHNCLTDYAASKDAPLVASGQRMAVPCPHCTSSGLVVSRVTPEGTPRTYGDSPGTATRHVACGSPVKPGDSLDTMQRKLLRFADMQSMPLDDDDEGTDDATTKPGPDSPNHDLEESVEMRAGAGSPRRSASRQPSAIVGAGAPAAGPAAFAAAVPPPGSSP